MNGRHTKIDTYEKFEQLEKMLNGVHNKDKHGFYRWFKFNALGVEYKLEWYKNLSTLSCGNFEVKFTHVSIDGCWPNRFKRNLNLSANGDDVFAIVPLEEY